MSLGFQTSVEVGSLHPQNFNMEPENKSLEKESPFGNHYF